MEAAAVASSIKQARASQLSSVVCSFLAVGESKPSRLQKLHWPFPKAINLTGGGGKWKSVARRCNCKRTKTTTGKDLRPKVGSIPPKVRLVFSFSSLFFFFLASLSAPALNNKDHSFVQTGDCTRTPFRLRSVSSCASCYSALPVAFDRQHH